HQLRPLFSFFQAQTLPIGVYATDKDFTPADTIQSDLLRDRITLAVARAVAGGNRAAPGGDQHCRRTR
ncbi:MAG: hypothetical protein RSF79_27730, partial [Janthinobacterium sp.]